MTTSGGDTIGSGFFTAAGDTFAGPVKLKAQVTATGGSGTVNFFIDGGIGANGSRSSGSNTNNGYLSSQATAVAFDSTVANTLAVAAVFGASASGQSITGNGSKFTRSGP